MKILSKRVISSKPIKEVLCILNKSACPYTKAIFKRDSFSMHCAKRRSWWYLASVPIKGFIEEHEKHVVVALEIHTNFSFWVGVIIALLGLIGECLFFFFESSRWIPYVGMIILGLIVSLQTFWDGAELLDLLEFKLIR